MKVRIIILLLSISITLNAQEITKAEFNKEKKIEFKRIEKLEGLKSNELFSNAKQWMTNTLTSEKNIIESANPELGRLIGKGYTLYNVKYLGNSFSIKLHYTIQIESKEGKYRLIISNLYTVAQGHKRVTTDAAVWFNPKLKGGKKYIRQNMNKIISTCETLRQSLSKSMHSSTAKSSDDW